MNEQGERQDRLVRALLEQLPFDHPTDDPQLLETHISRVILVGPYAYKIKRPVDLGFLDYSTLQRRRICCEEELRLNRRTAPDLYLDVVPFGGTPDQPRLGDSNGEIFEYAVRMVRFDQADLFSRRLAEGRLQTSVLDRLARELAAFHASLPGDKAHGSAEQVYAPMADNFHHIRSLNLPLPSELEQVERWTTERFAALRGHLNERHTQGHIRECHGDLHLNNVVLYKGWPVPFDGIEFNDELRFIDTVSEIAFLTMDLDDHHRPDLAARFLNEYLTWSGDFEGLPLLRFYQVYRAMVRAKVAALRTVQVSDPETRAAFESYLLLAASYTRPRPTGLLLTCGVAGSGKSTIARGLAEQFGAIHLRSDVERKRLFGLAPDADSRSAPGGGIYTDWAGRRTYTRLAELAEAVLAAGLPVIVDATFLNRSSRQEFARLAERCKVPYAIVYADAEPALLRKRVEHRLRAGADPSEANLEVLENQLARRRPPSVNEPVIRVDTGGKVSFPAVCREVAERIGLECLQH